MKLWKGIFYGKKGKGKLKFEFGSNTFILIVKCPEAIVFYNGWDQIINL